MKILPALFLVGTNLGLFAACQLDFAGPYHSQLYICQDDNDCIVDEGYNCIKLLLSDTDSHCVESCQEDEDCDGDGAICTNYPDAAPQMIGTRFCGPTPDIFLDPVTNPCEGVADGHPGECDVSKGEYCLSGACVQVNKPCDVGNDQCSSFLGGLYECQQYDDGSFCTLMSHTCVSDEACRVDYGDSSLVCIADDICAPANCDDALGPDDDPSQLQVETSDNCGGRCGPCDQGHRCLNHKDCLTGYCALDAFGESEKNCQTPGEEPGCDPWPVVNCCHSH